MMSFMIIMILWEKSVPKNDATACLNHQVLCNLNFLEKWSSDSKVKLKFCAINNDWIEAAVSDSERRAHTPGAALARRVSPVRNLRTRTDIRLGYKYHATDHFLIKSRLRFQADEYLTSWFANILLWTTTRSSIRAARGAPSRPCAIIPCDHSMSLPAQVSSVFHIYYHFHEVSKKYENVDTFYKSFILLQTLLKIHLKNLALSCRTPSHIGRGSVRISGWILPRHSQLHQKCVSKDVLQGEKLILSTFVFNLCIQNLSCS